MDRAIRVLKRLKGPVVPLNVCFSEDGQVDYAAMRRYVNWLCEQRTPVILLTYGSSEFGWMADTALWKLTAELAEEIDGRSLFVTSTGWWIPAVCKDFLRHANQVGADAVKVQINPWVVSMTDLPKTEVIVRFFDAIEGEEIPLLLWAHALAPYPIDTIRELAKRPQIVGMKNDDDPFYYYYDTIRATQDENFGVVSGGLMRNFIFGYPVGSTAYLCGVAPFLPSIALKFYDALVQGDLQEAWAVIHRYEDPWLKCAVEIGWGRSIKTAIHLYGLLPNDRLGSPGSLPTSDHRQSVRSCLEDVFGSIQKVEL